MEQICIFLINLNPDITCFSQHVAHESTLKKLNANVKNLLPSINESNMYVLSLLDYSKPFVFL